MEFNDIKVGSMVTIKNGLNMFEQYEHAFVNDNILNAMGREYMVRGIDPELSVFNVYGIPETTWLSVGMVEKIEEKPLACSSCGKELDLENALFDRMGNVLCQECAGDHVVRCDGCGASIDKLTDVYHEYEGKTYCEAYFNANFARCIISGEVYPITEMCETEDGYVLKGFLNDNFVACGECGKYYRKDHVVTIGDKVYCPKCISSIADGTVKGYHAYENWKIKNSTTDGNYKNIPIGFELEVSRGDDVNSDISNDAVAYMAIKKSGNLVVAERDGSINNGFELISHPMTMGYISNRGKDKLSDMFSFIKDIGFEGDDSCGLHFHVSRESLTTPNRSEEETIDNIILLVETFKREIAKFARRESCHYSHFLTDEYDDVYMTSVKKKKHEKCGDRYCAVNLTNGGTIEFRMFKSTVDFNTFMASIELINNIVNIARYKDIDGIKWKNIIEYRPASSNYIVEYNSGLGITSSKKVSVMSSFEKNKKNFTLNKFMEGKFQIHMDVRDSSNMYILLGAILGKNVTYHECYSSLRECLRGKYERGDVVLINKQLNNRLVSRGTTSMEDPKFGTVDLSDIVTLWVDNPELVD